MKDQNEQPNPPSPEILEIYEPYRGTPTCDDPRKLIVPIDSIMRDLENARLHPDRNIKQLRASLRRRGQTKPLVVSRDRVIAAGNGTHLAAEEEGWTHIWIVATHLTGAELKAYGIADNATGLSSEWDWTKLTPQLGELKSFDDARLKFADDDLGFAEHQLTPLLSKWKKPTPLEETPAPQKNKQAPQGEGDRADAARPIIVTPNQRVMIDRAIARVREISEDEAITEGRSIELICADYLA